MPDWVLPLALLACPIGMGLVMFFTMRGMRGGHKETMAGHKEAISPQERLAWLEAEKRDVEQQLAGGARGRSQERTAPSSERKKDFGEVSQSQSGSRTGGS